MKKWLIIFLCTLSISIIRVNIYSQSLKIKNIHYRIIEKQIEIFYDLPKNSDTIVVTISFRKKSDPKFIYYPQYSRGDIGTGVYSGPNKKIIWDIGQEPDYLFTGSGFYFNIKAVRLSKKEEDIIQKQP